MPNNSIKHALSSVFPYTQYASTAQELSHVARKLMPKELAQKSDRFSSNIYTL